ncbi:hypothetical protein J2795_000166 [Chryseobacterium bernardetii]|uniref:DUF262 domain-containing protein n=2 Tax=Chryseobacterium TaxID=59732 RepID=A0A543ENQ6_9FLAO|nr:MULTISPECIES: hypothetical protein [Chryseobacterium]MDR6369597.1 hypothetical protein [Chryseobacterium vietnamense]MDR6439481.1 hypothetical protein [Chryseobacterium bernardetii]TQM23204.1 hypothetical protein FB551_2938 [Chryseobacterium aquifrigidense]
MIELSTINEDLVIKSKFITGHTTYDFAIKNLYPLINRLDIQRNLQNPSFYRRLKDDILNGCIMPPITIAIIDNKYENSSGSLSDLKTYVNKHIENMFILDGIQRLNTLHNAYTYPEIDKSLDLKRPLFINLLICKSMDNLLYRMITLNNGQKPMSANHQIEILLSNIYNFDELGIKIITDKQKGTKGKNENHFEKSSIIKGYLAFITNSISIDNKKIIDEKMDNLLTKKIMESNITNDNLEFSDVINLINNLSESSLTKKWFDNTNNVIGFSVGIRKSYNYFKNVTLEDFEKSLSIFETTFKGLNLSTIKLSKERRNLVKFFIENFETQHQMSEYDLLDMFNDYTF